MEFMSNLTKIQQNKAITFASMPTIHTRYLGDLRTEAIHVNSGACLITDAPLDNQGKGASFSPTDTLCAALTSCMFTIMGIAARTHGIQIEGIQADTTKFMASGPRKVSRIEIRIYGFPVLYSDKEKAILEKAACTCPVALSLHPDTQLDINFEYGQA
jgi:uncharacterized OsmC-like protein